MTPYQTRLFQSIITTLRQIAYLQSHIDQDTSQMSLHYVTGKLVSDLRQLLKEYATADFLIVRCGCYVSSWPSEILLSDDCPLCGKSIDRLLSDGTWQSQAARGKLNLMQLERNG